MADKNSNAYCNTCNKTFTSLRYYKAHFKYKANAKCKDSFEHKQQQPAKRPTQPSALQPQQPKRLCVGNVDKEAAASALDAVVLEDSAARAQIMGQNGEESCVNGHEICVNDSTNRQNASVIEATIPGMGSDSDQDDNFGAMAADSDHEEATADQIPANVDQTGENNATNPKIPTRELLDQFKQYSEWATQNTCELSPDMEAGIKLLHILSTK